MKKFIFILLCLVLTAALVGPKFVGDIAKDNYHKSFDNYPNSDALFRFKHQSFEQSWFSSKAVTVIQFTTGVAEIDAVELVLTSTIQHGPVLFTADTLQLGLAYINSQSHFVGLPKAEQSFIDEHLGQQAITLTSWLDFEQLSHDTLSIKSFSIENEQVSSTFGGVELQGTSTLDYSAWQGEVNFPASQIITADLAINIADASATYQQRKAQAMLLGQVKLSLPLIEAVAQNVAFVFKDVVVFADISEDKGKLNVVERLTIANITAPIPVTAFQYSFEAQQIDPKAMQLWGELSQNMQLPAKQTKQGIDQAKLRSLLTALLQEGLALNQQLQIHGMGGKLNINWDTSYVPLANGQHLLDVQDTALLIQAINMHILFEIDAKIVMATPFSAMVEPYIKQGFIAKKGDKLMADIQLAQGVLTVNEQAIPMEMILPLLGLTAHSPPRKTNLQP